jgi:hypothetical protein
MDVPSRVVGLLYAGISFGEGLVPQQATTETSVARTRRSTRIAQAIPLTVMGVDAWRGPYREQVSTVSVSCHGCKYQSKYHVTKDSLVILELGPGQEGALLGVRGHVKWVQRPATTGELFETAVELESPGNVWRIASPPKDWLAFIDPGSAEVATSAAKPGVIARPAPALVTTKPKEAAELVFHSLDMDVTTPVSQPIVRLMSEFQGQIQRMLSEAATAAVAEQAGQVLVELRKQLQDEARQTLDGIAASCADHLVRRSVEQMNEAHQRNARALHEQWVKRIEADLRGASERLEVRSAELKQVAESAAASASERVQRVVEAAQRDGVSRFVSKLQQQLAPLLEYAQKASTDLAKRKEELEGSLQKAVQASAGRMQEVSGQAQKQFEQTIQDRLAKAREEFSRARTPEVILKGLQEVYESYEKQAQNSLRGSLDPVIQQATNVLREKAAEISRQFSVEMDNYTRSQLEYISGVIGQLAKGLGKRSGA